MRRADLICVVILLVLALFLGLEVRRLGYWKGPGIPGAGFFPFWTTVGLGVGAIGILLERRWRSIAGPVWFPSRDGMVRLSVLTILTVLLILAIQPLGLLLAVGLFLLVFLAIYTPGRWLLILCTAAGTPLILYVIFERWLKVFLPRGFLGF